MKKRKGLTPLEVIVVLLIIAAILFLFVIGSGITNRHAGELAKRVICGTNLKGLGTVLNVYSSDYDGNFPQLPGKGPWSKRLGFDYYMANPDFTHGGAQSNTPRTITASWFLLVKEADVNPKYLTCPASSQVEFDEIPADKNIVDLWDFGLQPHNHVSYVMQNPYGRFPAHAKLPATFAVAADMNPWFEKGDFVPHATGKNVPQIITPADPETFTLGNSVNHQKLTKKSRFFRTGQNVLFADGHVEWLEQPNCGINKDNIYTFWPTDKDPTAQDIQGGKNPTARDKENDSKSKGDSFLAI